ncbi:MAG: histidine kinase [Reichenbachiella sp.]
MGKLKEVHFRWGGIPIVGFIMSFLVKDPSHQQMTFWTNALVSIFFTALLWNGCYVIIYYFRRKFSSINETPKRLILSIMANAVLLTLGANFIALFLGLCTFKQLLTVSYFFRHSHVNLIAGFMVASIYESAYFFYKWKDSVQLNEELKNQQIRTQFEVLQNQMSPHFLFNSLNTLTTLIAEDPKIAIDFTQTLSEVYRYILQNKERELVSLNEELEFCSSYVFLLKKRYPENLHVKFEVDVKYKEFHIAPLTLQMLVENAIKHNTVSKTEPLYIEIYVDNGETIIVKNTLQLKQSLEKSTKTGLANIRKRYAYFGNREIDIITSNDHFMVAIPLIELLSEVEYSKSVVA